MNDRKKSSFGKVLCRILAVFLTFIAVLAVTLVIAVKMICSNISPSAKSTFVTTMLETGQLKFMATMFVDADEIQNIVDSNSMAKMDDEVDTDLITISAEEETDGNADEGEVKDIEVIDISGRTFEGHIIKVKDPSRISLATIYGSNNNSWPVDGVTLEQLAKDNGALAAINGGLYNSANNTGGKPYGLIVSNGEIQYNSPTDWSGLVIVGFDSKNFLRIIDINGNTAAEVEEMVKTNGIRDAVVFQEESSDSNNHFVQLVVNGNPRGLNGMGSGLNPRTAIGQCADGSVLLLVTDGRGKNGHLGASASDLIDIMTEYGAVNAANLDGGSSSCMYYDNEYLMTSVTFYYSNDSWKLPAAFIVK